jgi:hypothetical protein
MAEGIMDSGPDRKTGIGFGAEGPQDFTYRSGPGGRVPGFLWFRVEAHTPEGVFRACLPMKPFETARAAQFHFLDQDTLAVWLEGGKRLTFRRPKK